MVNEGKRMENEAKKFNKRRRKKQKNKKLFAIISIAAVAAILIAIINPFAGKGTVTVTIEEGTTSTHIAEQLKDEGVIRSKLWFLLRLSLSDYKGKLQYGTFKFDKGDSLANIFETLATKGAKKNTVTLTVPEGFSVEKIKERVCSLGLCTENEFEEALKSDYNYSFLETVQDDKNIKYRLQGFLYPSTYEFYSDADAKTVIDTMLSEFEKQVSPLNIPNDKLYEIITKASIIEREAKIDSERSTIAGVIENRLKNDMLLQIDATVVYALSDGLYNVDKVYYKNLEINSKYNTYKYKGLPPGPICNPSLKSIKAAYFPAKHNYLYYHTDTQKNDGSHIFTETYNEHTDSQK